MRQILHHPPNSLHPHPASVLQNGCQPITFCVIYSALNGKSGRIAGLVAVSEEAVGRGLVEGMMAQDRDLAADVTIGEEAAEAAED